MAAIGGGQAGLAAAGVWVCPPRKHSPLRRLGIDSAILDAQTTPGGAWQHTWDSLRLFSSAAYSSLPGRLMSPQTIQAYPDAQHVVRGRLRARPMFARPHHRRCRMGALSHLTPLQLRGRRGCIATIGTRAANEPRLHRLGYGDWTGPAAATLIGVGRPAREAARMIAGLLGVPTR